MKEKINRNQKSKMYTIPVEWTRVQVTHEVYQAYYRLSNAICEQLGCEKDTPQRCSRPVQRSGHRGNPR